MATDGAIGRLAAELELLQAMYPEAISFSPNAREIKYVHISDSDASTTAGTLLLRVPDLYPDEGLPEVLSASGPQREDLRSSVKEAIANSRLTPGEEALDAVVLSFQELLSSHASQLKEAGGERAGSRPDRWNGVNDINDQSRTVIIWLHHLLNTNKRKLALNPTILGPEIDGMAKPGYPGVLVFSGPKPSVDSHVSELRSQRWHAFQVRYDSEDDTEPDNKRRWPFEHGMGIREFESMSDLVQGMSNPRQREVFLSVMGVR